MADLQYNHYTSNYQLYTISEPKGASASYDDRLMPIYLDSQQIASSSKITSAADEINLPERSDQESINDDLIITTYVKIESILAIFASVCFVISLVLHNWFDSSDDLLKYEIWYVLQFIVYIGGVITILTLVFILVK